MSVAAMIAGELDRLRGRSLTGNGKAAAATRAMFLQLAAASLILSVLVAVPLGILAATRANRSTDHVATIFSLFGVSTPGFWLGILLILVFADQLRLLPPSGRDAGWNSLPCPGSHRQEALPDAWRRQGIRRSARQPECAQARLLYPQGKGVEAKGPRLSTRPYRLL